MWCEDFVSAYRSKPVNQLFKYYNCSSVFVEMTENGRWTEPVTGARNIVERLAELDSSVGKWPLETCQRMRTGGLLAVLLAMDGARQILIVHRSAGNPPRPVVCNHFYLSTKDGYGDGDADDKQALFKRRYESWAMSLNHTAFERYRTALHVGTEIVREYYVRPVGSPDDGSCWRLYDPEARFSCTKYGKGGGRVYTGLYSVRKRYARLSLDYRCVTLQAVDCCWTAGPWNRKREPNTVVTLTVGTVPRRPAGQKVGLCRKFVQFFVIDTRTKTILNDVLCFDARPPVDAEDSRSCSTSYDSWSSDTDDISTFPASSDNRSPSTSSSSENICGRVALTADHLTALRSRVTSNVLKNRSVGVSGGGGGGGGGDSGSGAVRQKAVGGNVFKLNPRQLFIGCVPLHVKYGQLKLLFERFGEVTYVKVYDGYNKHTGAKMAHNYAFLFFKDEASVEKAIAASPVPLDANWNLNVSRPHQHTTAAAIDH